MLNRKTIWCNVAFAQDLMAMLTRDLSPDELVFSRHLSQSILVASGHDELLAQASIAFGQPDPQQVIDSPQIKWVHLTTAGYTRYDTDPFRDAMKARNGMLTNSSSVYAKPCAEHAMAMMMAMARQLPQALDDQRVERKWPSDAVRSQSKLLSEQSVLIYGFGSIARELIQFLKSFGMKITGVRRHAVGDEGVPIATADQADALLAHTDHVVNILPASPRTDKFFDAKRITLMSPSTLFYNIGRGTTVDQEALQDALSGHRIAGAYLDVTVPEPLPPQHPLWRLPNCWITPHSAGGHHDEQLRLVKHFRHNLDLFSRSQTLLNRVI